MNTSETRGTIDLKKGDKVEWNWGSGIGEGEVSRVHKSDVEKTIKGSRVKRKASAETPAVEVITDKGAKVLKSVSEVTVKSAEGRRRASGGH